MRKIVVYDYSGMAKELLPRLKNTLGEVVLATKNRAEFDAAAEDGFSPILVDLSQDANLKKIGIGESVTDLFCICDDDEANLYTTLSARALSPSLNILARASDADSKKKLTLAGANEVIDFNEIGAVRIFHLLKRESALKFLDAAIYRDLGEQARLIGVELFELEVARGSFADKKALFDLNIESSYNLIVLGVLDNQISKKFMFNVNSFNHTIDSGDVIVAMGKREDAAAFAALCGAQI